ncbi:prohibitin family protein [Rhodovibrionaceae bacterium A322]
MSSKIERGFNAWVKRNYVGLSVSSLIVVFVVLVFAPYIFITVPAGHAGALWLRFLGGTITSWHYDSGTKIILPWDKIQVYDMRLQQMVVNVDALTQDGLLVQVEVSTRYRLNPETIGFLHKNVGPDFITSLIAPEIGARVRHEISRYTPEALYSGKREDLQLAIADAAHRNMELVSDQDSNTPNYIFVEDTLIRSVTLPETVRMAIAQKNVQRQRAEQYKFILERERMESHRKAIEAAGIRVFQETVTSGINENYLRWKGIDATLRLAESNNAKMVVIGAGEQGMPLILGNWDSSAPVEGSASQTAVDKKSQAAVKPQNPEDIVDAVNTALQKVSEEMNKVVGPAVPGRGPARLKNDNDSSITYIIDPLTGNPVVAKGTEAAAAAAAASQPATPAEGASPAESTSTAEDVPPQPPVSSDSRPSQVQGVIPQ